MASELSKIKFSVKCYPPFDRALGGKRIEIVSESPLMIDRLIGQLVRGNSFLEEYARGMSGGEEYCRFFLVFLNGVEAKGEEMIKDGDEVSILGPMQGGA